MFDLKVGQVVIVNTPDLYFDGRKGTITSIDDGVVWDDGRIVGTIEVQLDDLPYLCRFNPDELVEAD